MGYKGTIASKISATEQREAERLALWQALAESFEAEGPEGVEEELARRMSDIRRRFDAQLAKLESML